MKRILILIVIGLMWSSILKAQTGEETATPDMTPTATETGLQVQLTDDVVAQLSVDGDSVLIGEPFTLTLTISTLPGISIDNWPELPNDPLVFEVLDAAEVEEIEANERVEYQQELIVTLWQPGLYLTPEIAVEYVRDNGQVGAVPLQSASINVESVLINAVAPSLRPAAPPIDTPYIPPAVYVILVVVSATALWLVLRLLGGGLRQIRFVTQTTPLQRAVAGLADIEQQNLPPVAALPLAADILRRYLAERFEIPATEQTTAELLQSVSEWMPSQRQRQLGQILNQADLAKFAQHAPDSDLTGKVTGFATKWLRAIDGLTSNMEVTQDE